jgi:tetratricopeptide (TPR) repeat protein
MRLPAFQRVAALFLILLGSGYASDAADEVHQKPAWAWSRDVRSGTSYRLGLQCARRGELGAAQRHFTRAIRLDPRNIFAFMARANVRSLRGDLIGALGDADYTIQQMPASAPARLVRARIYAREALWASAEDDYRMTAALDPKLGTANLFSEWAIALMAQARFADAVANFTRAISMSAGPAEHYFHRSYAYERLGRLEAAISDLNATLQASPTHPEAHHRRASLFLRMGMDQLALIDLTIALEHDSADLRALADRALLHQRLGNLQAAAADLVRLSQSADAHAPILEGEAHWIWPW